MIRSFGTALALCCASSCHARFDFDEAGPTSASLSPSSTPGSDAGSYPWPFEPWDASMDVPWTPEDDASSGLGGDSDDEGGSQSSLRLPCTDDSTCPSPALHCDPPTGECFECTNDVHCTALGLARCDAALRRCVECGVDQDCGDGRECDFTARRCLQRCERNDDCLEPGSYCDDDREVCVECDDHRDCDESEDEGDYCGLGGTGCVECVENSDCDEWQVCDPLGGRCVECRTSLDCNHHELCDPRELHCVDL